MITKEQFLLEVTKLNITLDYFNEVNDNHVKYYSLDDPYAEQENSFLSALIHAAKGVGFIESRKLYRPKLLIADRTINALRNKYKDYTTKGNTEICGQ